MKVTCLTFQFKMTRFATSEKEVLKNDSVTLELFDLFLLATVVQISLRHGFISRVLRISYRLLVSINRSSVLIATIF